MIKGSKGFLIITFLIAFSLAFYLANKMYPIFGNKVAYVTQVAIAKNKRLPLQDENKNTLTQIIAYEPNQLQFVFAMPTTESYKLDTDSLALQLNKMYEKPKASIDSFLINTDQDLILEYVFKDKNNTKITSFKHSYTSKKN